MTEEFDAEAYVDTWEQHLGNRLPFKQGMLVQDVIVRRMKEKFAEKTAREAEYWSSLFSCDDE